MASLLPEGEGLSSIHEYCRFKLSNVDDKNLLNALPRTDDDEHIQAGARAQEIRRQHPSVQRPERSLQPIPHTFTLPIHTKHQNMPKAFALPFREARPQAIPQLPAGTSEGDGMDVVRPQIELPFRFVTRPPTKGETKDVVLVAKLGDLSKNNSTTAQAAASAQETRNNSSPFASLKPVFMKKEGKLWK